MKTPRCKICKEEMIYDGLASMGSFHSNWYKCPKCGKIVDVRDCDLDDKYLDV